MSGAMIFLNCVLPFVGERMICKKKTMDMSGYSCVCVKYTLFTMTREYKSSISVTSVEE